MFLVFGDGLIEVIVVPSNLIADSAPCFAGRANQKTTVVPTLFDLVNIGVNSSRDGGRFICDHSAEFVIGELVNDSSFIGSVVILCLAP